MSAARARSDAEPVLGVEALDKTGRHAEAIETILRKEALQPGLYETYANLGTFHIHAGRWEEGLNHIRKAIEINPDAHFGREIYQQKLVEYLIDKRGEDKQISLPVQQTKRAFSRRGFAKFLAPDQAKPVDPKALKGILGMMRFGMQSAAPEKARCGSCLATRSLPACPGAQARWSGACVRLSCSPSDGVGHW